jgi:hypothetical protein
MQNVTNLHKKNFRIKILKTLGDGLLYFSQYFFLVAKLHVFRIKILGTLADALTSRISSFR